MSSQVLFAGSVFGADSSRHNIETIASIAPSTSSKVRTWNEEQKIYFCDEVAKTLTRGSGDIGRLIRENDIGFVLAWLKRANIVRMLKENRINVGTESTALVKLGKRNYWVPKGTLVHWIAGNVPVLGIISLFQGILTGNVNLVKAPANFKEVLPRLLEFITQLNFRYHDITLSGSDFLSGVCVLYIEREDLEAQRTLSRLADVRVAWGGMEAVEAISQLPKKIDCKDVIFGPKVSLAMVWTSQVSTKETADEVADNLANDVFAFNQAGCNAPHNLLLVENEEIDLEVFFSSLLAAFEKRSDRKHFTADPADAYEVLTKRFIYGSSNEKTCIASAGLEFTLLINRSAPAISPPLYLRTLTISNGGSVEKFLDLFPNNIQTVGMACPDNLSDDAMDKLINAGVCRITKLGQMSLYTNPWDGLLPMNEMVKWVSVENG
ncbi:hypothetical protein OAL49_01780 [Gammaproteobacteria bacterium]|nr:hypothetical protein [Gammaproteobacteria bacterium]